MSDIELEELVINEAESDEVVEQQTNLGSNQIIVTPTGSSSVDYYGLPVGSVFASTIPIVDARVHLLDGSLIAQSGVYGDFAALIKNLVAAGQPITCTQAEFNADVATYGQCGKFVIDETNNAIRLPKITEFIASNNGGQSIGLVQLDEFKSHNHQITLESDGAIVSYNLQGGSSGNTLRFSSAGNIGNRNGADGSHYTGGSETRPKNVRYPYYIVLAAGYKQQSQLDVDNIMNDINGLAGQFEQKPWLLDVYPVGSIVLTLNEHGSPASIFGGTWEKIKDCFLWASGDTSSITYTENGTSVTKSLLVGERGGELTHTLTVDEMPRHTHLGLMADDVAGNSNAAKMAYNNYINRQSMSYTGGDSSHNNMPPYLAVNMYKRIS